MGAAAGEVIFFGVGVALSPLATIAVVLMLAGPAGRRSAWAFFGAWALALMLVCAVVLLVADVADADDDGASATWVSVVKLVLAAALLWVAWRQWRDRGGNADEPSLPSFLQGVEAYGPPKAAGLAVALAAVKPKNPILAIGAGVSIAQSGAGAGAQALALCLFVVLGSLAPGAPLALALVAGQRSDALLERTRAWMVRENATIIAVLCLAFAAKLIVDGVGSPG